MFDPKEIEAYRKISAPVDLKDKILSSCTDAAPKKRNLHEYRKWISSIAACFVLVAVLAVVGVGNYGAVSVSVSDSELGKEQSVTYVPNDGVQSISVYRESVKTADAVIPLLFDGHAELSVSGGVMNIVDTKDTEKVLYSGTEYSMDGKTLVCWAISADDDAYAFEMTVQGTFQTEYILLTYDSANDIWTVSRKGED